VSSGTDRVVPGQRYELLELGGPASGDDVLVFMAFSGGGKRSSAFAYGVLEGMRELEVPGPDRHFIDLIDMITGVSGGSFTAAAYGLHGEELFDGYTQTFLYDPTGDRVAGLYLLPWRWEWLASGDYSRSDAMAEVYDDLLFQRATYSDLFDNGRPMIVLGATDVVLGTSFIFTQRQFDLLCADLNSMQLSRAVAASNGFPGLFSPITLESYDQPCGRQEPDWLDPLTDVSSNTVEREAIIAGDYRAYLDPNVRYVHLMDGGIADNLALRGLINAIVLFNNLEDVPDDSEYLGIRRILFLSVDGEAAPDLTRSGESDISGLEQIFSAVSGTQIDRYNEETLLLSSLVLDEFREQIVRLRCLRGPTIEGKRCNDVEALFVHLSLRDLPDVETRERLAAIPTGLSLDPADIDALVAAGRDVVMSSRDISVFMALLN
jgi:NTE family protein